MNVFTDEKSCSSLHILDLNHQDWRMRGSELKGIAQLRYIEYIE